jgi:hypothetical protein
MPVNEKTGKSNHGEGLKILTTVAALIYKRLNAAHRAVTLPRKEIL